MSLATSSQPLILADGRHVYPDGRIIDPNAVQEVVLIAVPTNREAVELVTQARKKLADLPDVPRTMNAIGVVLSYSLFGLANMEIALATGLTETQVGTIIMGDAYKEMRQGVVTSILEAETDNVRDLFQQSSRMAVDKMLGIMATSKSETNKIIIARDILDRAGHRPADVVEHRHRMDGGLTIEIIQRDASNVMPIIDMEISNDC